MKDTSVNMSLTTNGLTFTEFRWLMTGFSEKVYHIDCPESSVLCTLENYGLSYIWVRGLIIINELTNAHKN